MTAATNVLLVEDDERIRNYIKTSLLSVGYAVLEAETLRMAHMLAASYTPDLILIDLGLPDGDGLSLIHDLRTWSKVPIIVVSARDHEHDKVSALDAGADDYITKPFGADELLARIRAALRRMHSGATGPEIYSARGFYLDADRRQLTIDGQPIHLTQTEYRIVLLLCRHSGRVMTYEAIVRDVWGPYSSCDTQILRVNMANIRRKLEKDVTMPEYITTEIGVGYRMIEMDGESH